MSTLACSSMQRKSQVRDSGRSLPRAQVLGLTGNVRKMFRDMDEGLYEECRLRYEAEEVRLPTFLSDFNT